VDRGQRRWVQKVPTKFNAGQRKKLEGLRGSFLQRSLVDVALTETISWFLGWDCPKFNMKAHYTYKV
jgi:hypothetical protein